MPEAAETLPLASTIALAVALLVLFGVALFIVFRRRGGTARSSDRSARFAGYSDALRLFAEAMSPEALIQAGLRLIVDLLRARYGLILSGPDPLILVHSFNPEGRSEPSGPPLQSKALPEITSSIVGRRAVILASESEIIELAEAYALERAGAAMIAPLRLPDDQPAGLMLLSNDSTWSPPDLRILEEWCGYLGRRFDDPPGLIPGSDLEETEMLKGELRLALEELSEGRAFESSGSLSQVGTLTSRLETMREPIASIQRLDTELRTYHLDEAQLNSLDQIRANAAQLQNQLTQLLHLIQVPRGAAQSSVEIRDIVSLAESQVSSELEQSEIALERELPDSLPSVTADPDLLRQVVVLLLERAISISPSNSQIQITAGADDEGWVSLAVSDRGPGIAAENLGRVFQPEVAAGGADQSLPQVRTLAESLGSKVWIGSEMGTGSTVTVLIPASEGAVADKP